MPELPEIKTIVNVLSSQILNTAIIGSIPFDDRIIGYPDATHFSLGVIGQKIVGIKQRGKFLYFQFETGDRLYIHLRLTGRLLVKPKNYPIDKDTCIIFDLDDGSQLRYMDARKFGKFWFIKFNESDNITGISKLGLEPNAITAEYLKIKLQNKRCPIKTALLDQTIVAGIGNIYSDEILFQSKISPLTKCNKLNDQQIEALSLAIKQEITAAIAINSNNIETYLINDGRRYNDMSFLQAYGHELLPCPYCGTNFMKIKINGRDACYCPNCQK